MRRLLVVSYYAPPLGLSGVMRITKLCKFLPEAGWRPLLLTVNPVAYYAYDPGLLADLRETRFFRTESADPNRLLHLLRAKRRRLAPVLAERAGRLARVVNAVLLPDAKVGWLPFASVVGRHVIDREKPDAILATSPPFTALLIGVRLKAHGHIPLVVDFRDPWPAGFALPARWQRAPLRYIRSYVLRHADLALAVNAGTARMVGPQVQVLDNGFDPTEFEVPPYQFDGFSIVHVGNLWRNDAEVMSVVEALRPVPGVRLHLVGGVGVQVAECLKSNAHVVLHGVVSHERACAMMAGADVLLYVSKPGQPAGIKLYEYLGAKRPVLVWGADGKEAAEIVAAADAGVACGTDPDRLRAALAAIRDGSSRFTYVGRERYDRRRQAVRLAEEMERLVLRWR